GVGVLILARRNEDRAPGRGALGHRSEAAILPQDRPFELLEGRARLEAELLGERPSRRLVRLESVRLPSGPVEGKHELLPQSLAQRELANQGLQLADELGVPA